MRAWAKVFVVSLVILWIVRSAVALGLGTATWWWGGLDALRADAIFAAALASFSVFVDKVWAPSGGDT